MAVNTMIYTPAKTCTEEEYCKMWQECQDANVERMNKIEEIAKKSGSVLYRFLYESVADGKAIYQIIKVNKRTARVRLCSIDGCFYDYVVPQWGTEATVSLEYVKKQIDWQDKVAEMFH